MVKMLSILLLALCLSSCCGANAPQQQTATDAANAEPDTAYMQYEAMIRDFLVGKRIASLQAVMAPDSVPHGKSVLMVYHGMDCGSCMDAGFGLLKRLREAGVACTVVAVDANSAEAQQRYEYFDYIYTDREDRLRRELKYVNTPVLLLLDDSLAIVNIHKPAAAQDQAAAAFEQVALKFR